MRSIGAYGTRRNYLYLVRERFSTGAMIVADGASTEYQRVGRAGSPSRPVPGCQLGSRRAARRSAPTAARHSTRIQYARVPLRFTLGFSPVKPSAYLRKISWYRLIEVRSITLNTYELEVPSGRFRVRYRVTAEHDDCLLDRFANGSCPVMDRSSSCPGDVR